MITLSVISFNGAAPAHALCATFGEQGGSIGRADGNLLVLPDPERTISRIHAQVVWRGGRFAIVDRGSNPIEINGRLLAGGTEADLSPGDEIAIGGYRLRVEAPGAPKPPPSVRPADDRSGSAPAAGVHAAKPSMAGIPDDWDPFGPSAASPAAQARSDAGGAVASDPFVAFGLAPTEKAQPLLADDLNRLQRPAENSIDAMFDLGPPSGGDPFAGSSLAAPLSQPNTASHADPLQSLAQVAPVAAAPVSDAGSDLNAWFVAPRLMPPPVVAIAAPGVAAWPAGDPVLSWEHEPAARGVTILAPVARAVRDATRGSAPLTEPLTEPRRAAEAEAEAEAEPVTMIVAPSVVRPAPRQQPDPQADRGHSIGATAAAADAGTVDQAALTQALRDGLGLPDLALPALTPDFMRLVGVLLREATSGTVDMLVARAALKREIHAEITMIAARENNPLKFSPNAEVALQHLLGPATRGFMAAAPAMRDAYCDLRAHQFGMVAGLRAALEGVLKRFDPAALETRLGEKSMLANLLPATRKARLWELFNALYAQLSAEADDDFHELFGKAFLRAYEAHVDELRKAPR